MGAITIASWNMNQNANAWKFLDTLRDDHGVQVALLQEAVPPPAQRQFPRITPAIDAQEHWKIPVPPKVKRNFASAIVLLDESLSLTPMPATRLDAAEYDALAASHPGQFAVARLAGGALVNDVVLVSLYGLWHTPSGNGAEATLHRAISDLTSTFLENPRVVLAGDLNLFRNTDNLGQVRFDTVFSRLDAYGLKLHGPFRAPDDPPQVDCACNQGDGCDHVETFRIWRSSARAYQDDYVFGTEALRLQSCKALIDPVTDYSDRSQRLSDHWPIVARFEL